MNLLITGGAGFIGSNLVSWIINNRPHLNVRVYDALTYAAIGQSTLEELGVEVIKGDVRDRVALGRALKESDTVIHLAAESHNDNSIKSPGLFFDTNVQGTIDVAQLALERNIRLHHVSTDEVFGDLPINSLDKFNEESPYRPSSPYSASKASADHVIRAWVRTYGLRATISNCSNNYGPNQHPEKLIPRQIGLIKSGGSAQLYGTGNNIRDWIHVDDHASGIFNVLEKGRLGETYLLGADCERSNLEVVSTLNQALGQSRGNYQLINDRPGHDLRYAIDSSKAQVELGWKPEKTDFERELESLVDYY